MDRRGFLRALGLGVAAAAAPTKAYSFLGGIYRPSRKFSEGEISTGLNYATLKVYLDTVRGMRELTTQEYQIINGVLHVAPKITEADGRFISVNYEVSGTFCPSQFT